MIPAHIGIFSYNRGSPHLLNMQGLNDPFVQPIKKSMKSCDLCYFHFFLQKNLNLRNEILII